jgi:hypothetical protein
MATGSIKILPTIESASINKEIWIVLLYQKTIKKELLLL